MKNKNKVKLNKNIKLIAVGLVMVLAVSALVAVVLSVDNKKPVQNHVDKLTTCDIWGHNWVETPGLPATCYADGYTGSKYCSVCDTVDIPKETLSRHKAHSPVYENGIVQCETCDADFGANYYYVDSVLAGTDYFVESEYVTLVGTVVTKGCNSFGSIYSLFVCGSQNDEMIRVDFINKDRLEPFVVGGTYAFTGNLIENYVPGCYKLYNITAYKYLSDGSQDLQRLIATAKEESFSYLFLDVDFENHVSYYGKPVFVDNFYVALSGTSGNVSNYVRFNRDQNLVCSGNEDTYCAYSVRYLREFTNYTQGSLVNFNGYVPKPRDKTPVHIPQRFVSILAYVGPTTLEFVFLDTNLNK